MSLLKNIAFLILVSMSVTVVGAEKPNIILIYLDDLGWRDVGFMGNPIIETPALDKLAREGLVLTQAYSNAPNCAPSRAALMSGQYAPRTGVYTMLKGDMGDTRLHRVLTPENKIYLEPHIITMAEMLKTAGYRTAHVGKWNLGTGDVRGPTGQGFDINIAGSRGGETHSYFAPYDLPGLENAPAGEYLTDRLTQEAIQIIQQKTDQPFFIYLSHFAPHYPYQAPDNLVKKYRAKNNAKESPTEIMAPELAAMIDSVDQGISRIVDTLKAQNLDKNTLIIFTADNGGYDGASYMNPLRGQKSLLYEGGIRVPMLLWWPNKITSGSTDTPVIGTDIFPTLMKVAGVPSVDQPLDGTDLSPLFGQTKNNFSRDTLYWYFPAYIVGLYDEASDATFQQRPAAVIRKQEWKLIQFLDSPRIELYNLTKDPAEKNNVADQETIKREELTGDLQRWMDDMKIKPLPVNPNYSAAYEEQYTHSWLRKLRKFLGHGFQENDLQ